MKHFNRPDPTDGWVLRQRSLARGYQPRWTPQNQQTFGLSVFSLLHAPLGYPSLYLVLRSPENVVIFAQPLCRSWGTSITNGTESLVDAATDRFGQISRLFEWYYDEGTFDEILVHPGSGLISWRPFASPDFETLYSLKLPALAKLPFIHRVERDYLQDYPSQ